MDAIGFILLAALSGLVVGALARLIIPGPDPMSVLQTMLVGVAGSIVAGLITYYAFDRQGAPGILLAVVCSAVLVFAIRKLRERQLGPAANPRLATLEQPGRLVGSGVQVRFMPGCLIFSLLASLFLTVMLNLVLRAL